MKFLIVTCSLILTSLAVANTNYPTILSTGNTISADVKGSNPMVLDVSSVGAIKSVAVTNEYAGFECEIQKLTTSSETSNLVEIAWSPGGDQSGCEIQVTGSNGTAKADLYMDYL